MSNSQMNVIGLMSGTSLDGVDLALVKFSIHRKKVKYSIVRGKTFSYPKKLLVKLKDSRNLSGLELSLLNNELGRFYGSLILEFKEKDQVDLISSHGHTVFHQPEKALTLQIGSGAEIAAKTGIKTICDFRSTDVALNGQGAPLVPFGDELLFPEYNYCLNLGGYANISFREKKLRKALDICPCNVVLNALSNEKGQEYDDKGKMASRGNVDSQLLKKLNEIDFYKEKKNKSLGNEWTEKHIFPILSKSKISIENKLATFTEHIAIQISVVVKKNNSVLITGGGAMNDFLMERLGKISGAKLIKPDTNLIHFKEALVFALLGYMREKEWVNTLSTATGSIRNSSGGAVYFP